MTENDVTSSGMVVTPNTEAKVESIKPGTKVIPLGTSSKTTQKMKPKVTLEKALKQPLTKQEKAEWAPKAKKAPKVKAPQAAKVKAPAKTKGGPTLQRKDRSKVGPAMKRFKFKKDRKPGECDVLGCKVNGLAPARRCHKHKKLIRKAQLKANNVVWRKRVKEGTAGNHAVYTFDGDQVATKFARKESSKALAAVKAGHAVVDEKGFKKALAAAEVVRKAKAKVKKVKAKKAA